jgi:hypothetical protein
MLPEFSDYDVAPFLAHDLQSEMQVVTLFGLIMSIDSSSSTMTSTFDVPQLGLEHGIRGVSFGTLDESFVWGAGMGMTKDMSSLRVLSYIFKTSSAASQCKS